MKTPICELLGIEFPLLAFSHCRDVVAAVTNAGGFGVLGATGFDAEALELELKWIDEHVGDRPYGVDLLVPGKLEGKDEGLDVSALQSRIPTQHKDFVRDLLAQHGIPPDESDPDSGSAAASRMTDSGAQELLDVAFSHPIKLIASALGVAPQYMIDRAKRENIPVAALVGAKEHAIKQAQAGVDVIIAQGHEAGGHTGEVAGMVLVPEVIEAIKPIREIPVLAAGGIVTGRQMAAALTLGAAGVWTGSVWLTTEEAETIPAVKEKMLTASSRDTLRSPTRTGKPARQLRTDWHEAWEAPNSPSPLPMPLQGMLTEHAFHRIDVAAEHNSPGARDLATYFVGQGVGLLTRVRPARDVVYEILEDFTDAVTRLTEITAE